MFFVLCLRKQSWRRARTNGDWKLGFEHSTQNCGSGTRTGEEAMNWISRAMWGATICGVLCAVGSGCSKPKEPPPGAPTDNTNALPTVDLGAGAGPSEGSTLEPSAG